MSPKPFIPVILGPTASSKTSVGIELAKLIDGEVISVDSRKVYQGLPIGTATPPGVWEGKKYLVQGIPHYLMAHISPDVIYNAGDFILDSEALIEDIQKRGKTPIFVGGTGFYFKALKDGLPAVPDRNDEIREKLTQKIEKEGLDALYEDLKREDPVAALTIKSGDPHKIIRALEVTALTGRPFSTFKESGKKVSPHNFVVMGLHYAKGVLDRRIEERSRKMVQSGMIEETDALLKKGFSKSCPALRSFGYAEAVQVLEGGISKDEFLRLLIKGTMAYAKRQRTWFRTKIQPTWFETDEKGKSAEIALKMKAFCNRPN